MEGPTWDGEEDEVRHAWQMRVSEEGPVPQAAQFMREGGQSEKWFGERREGGRRCFLLTEDGEG